MFQLKRYDGSKITTVGEKPIVINDAPKTKPAPQQQKSSSSSAGQKQQPAVRSESWVKGVSATVYEGVEFSRTSKRTFQRKRAKLLAQASKSGGAVVKEGKQQPKKSKQETKKLQQDMHWKAQESKEDKDARKAAAKAEKKARKEQERVATGGAAAPEPSEKPGHAGVGGGGAVVVADAAEDDWEEAELAKLTGPNGEKLTKNQKKNLRKKLKKKAATDGGEAPPAAETPTQPAVPEIPEASESKVVAEPAVEAAVTADETLEAEEPAAKKRKVDVEAPSPTTAEDAPENESEDAEDAPADEDAPVDGDANLAKLRLALHPKRRELKREAEKKLSGVVEEKKKEPVKIDWTERYVVMDQDLRTPVEEMQEREVLDGAIVQTLKQRMKIQELFPVQSGTIPFFHKTFSEGYADPFSAYNCDLCVSAPTGQGKTLSYVLPMLQALGPKRVVPRISGLILVPVRDLAVQVARVIEDFAEVIEKGEAGGERSFTEEAARAHYSSKSNVVACLVGGHSLNFVAELDVLKQKPDFVVLTPGKLEDHFFARNSELAKPENVQEYRWFVFDEADRLLNGASDGNARWLDVVKQIDASRRAPRGSTAASSKGSGGPEDAVKSVLANWKKKDKITDLVDLWSHKSSSHAKTAAAERVAAWPYASAGYTTAPVPLRKILLSATMTKNPRKLSLLNLYRPMFFLSTATGQHSTPDTLTQGSVLTREKPRALIACLLEQCLRYCGEAGADRKKILVFCSSVEETHRVARILELFFIILRARMEEEGMLLGGEGGGENKDKMPPQMAQHFPKIAEFSSMLTQSEREALLERFKKGGEIDLLVCSDVMARGMDIPLVDLVINLDVPKVLKTYIHRIGRTARAGKEGRALTLLKTEEIKLLKQLLKRSEFGFRKVQYTTVGEETWFRQQPKTDDAAAVSDEERAPIEGHSDDEPAAAPRSKKKESGEKKKKKKAKKGDDDGSSSDSSSSSSSSSSSDSSDGDDSEDNELPQQTAADAPEKTGAAGRSRKIDNSVVRKAYINTKQTLDLALSLEKGGELRPQDSLTDTLSSERMENLKRAALGYESGKRIQS